MIKPKFKSDHVSSDTSALTEILERFKRAYVKNGVLAGIGAHPNSESGATVAAIAAWNNFGTLTIPARPYMTLAYNEFSKDIAFMLKAFRASIFAKKGDRLLKKPKVKLFFELCGMKIQSLMVAQIDSNIAPENAESTKAAKGSEHTLFDTGLLKQSQSYEVVSN